MTRAIKRLEDIKTGKCQKTFVFTEGLFDYIFPELKESEDEMVRKAIIEHFEGSHSSMYPYKGFTKEQILAWLEKQGEHANFLSKIQAGDKVTRNEDGVLVNLSQLNRVANKQGEQKLLYVNDNAKEMFIKALECVEEQNNKGYKLTDCDKKPCCGTFSCYGARFLCYSTFAKRTLAFINLIIANNIWYIQNVFVILQRYYENIRLCLIRI